MMDAVQVGTRVIYHPVIHSRCTSVGIVKKILTNPGEVGQRHAMVSASEDSPRYVIENHITHKESAYRAENIESVLL